MALDRNDPADEPLARWAARRAKRLRPVGACKTITLGPGAQRAAHLFPELPRLIVEWDGTQWTSRGPCRQLRGGLPRSRFYGHGCRRTRARSQPCGAASRRGPTPANGLIGPGPARYSAAGGA
ncbi:DUF6087 family protein [Streptomyces klenkii]|uniref:DUF6087 family protein n=1 Tax=Streptomyces klenkii TaxID=1420899 RepID=UPI0034268FCF